MENETVAARCRLARAKREISQRGLALRCGLSETYVVMVERGDDAEAAPNQKIVNPGTEPLRLLAKQLKVPFAWLAFGEGDEPLWEAA